MRSSSRREQTLLIETPYRNTKVNTSKLKEEREKEIVLSKRNDGRQHRENENKIYDGKRERTGHHPIQGGDTSQGMGNPQPTSTESTTLTPTINLH